MLLDVLLHSIAGYFFFFFIMILLRTILQQNKVTYRQHKHCLQITAILLIQAKLKK